MLHMSINEFERKVPLRNKYRSLDYSTDDKDGCKPLRFP